LPFLRGWCAVVQALLRFFKMSFLLKVQRSYSLSLMSLKGCFLSDKLNTSAEVKAKGCCPIFFYAEKALLKH
jgi:hypothetical protein